MYCGRCGNQLDEGQAYCDRCGQRSGDPAPPRQQYQTLREKSEGAAAVLSFLCGGLGQIYVGKIARGLVIMLGYILLMIFTFFLMIVIMWDDGDLTALGILILFLGVVGQFIIWIWNIFDAHKLAREYNDRLRSTGMRPW